MPPNRRSMLLMGFVSFFALGIASVELARAGDVDSLAWLAGTWVSDTGRVEMEEHWTVPKGGTMLGIHRDVIRGRTVSFEFFRIAADSAGIIYFASPRGVPPTPFRLVEAKGQRVVFENRKHDYPQRILYWIAEDGALHARTEGPGKSRGIHAEEWRWIRAAGGTNPR